MSDLLQRVWRTIRKVDYWTWWAMVLLVILVLFFTMELWLPHWSVSH